MSSKDEIIQIGNDKFIKRYSVRKRDASAKAKIVADRKNGCTVERVTSREVHKCEYDLCSYYLNEIEPGQTYVLVTDPSKPGGIFVQGRVMAPKFRFHVDCIPPDLKGTLIILELRQELSRDE